MPTEEAKAGAHPTGRFHVDPSPSAGAIVDRPVDRSLTDLIVESYEGERDEAGRFTGPAVVAFAGGHTYRGSFLDGMMHGDGTYTWCDGVTYTGSFALNKVTGTGTFTWPDGSIYAGEVRNGLRHGSGRFQCGGSPVHYDGEWKGGKRHGKGTMFYDVAGTAFYRGGWKEDCRHGHGVAVYPSGNTYDGDWANDMKNGSGTMEWKTRKEVYTGEWKDDKPDGRGSHVWQEGRAVAGAAQKQMCNRYEGEMANGLRNGLGVFYYSNGAQYDGEWVDGKKHGNGVFTFEDGEIYEGEFISDRMADPRRRVKSDSRSGGTNTRMITLKIDDLLAGMPRNLANRVQQETHNVLLRWNSDLKQIYQYYSVVGTSSVDGMFTLSTKQFWRFIKDSRITDSVLTVARIDRTITEMRRRHANAVQNEVLKRAAGSMSPRSRHAKEAQLAKTARGDGAHDPKRPILFREFLESLVRIAEQKYTEGLLQRRVQSLLTLVKKHAMQEATDPFRRLLVSPEIREIVTKFDPFLRVVFGVYCAKDRSTRHAREADKSINVREFLLLLKDAGVINTTFKIGHVMKIFLKANYEVEDDLDMMAGLEDDHPVDNLDSEMVYAEFIEGIARVAHQVYHQYTRATYLAKEKSLGMAPEDTELSGDASQPLSLGERLQAFIKIDLMRLSKTDATIKRGTKRIGTSTRRGSVLV